MFALPGDGRDNAQPHGKGFGVVGWAAFRFCEDIREDA